MLSILFIAIFVATFSQHVNIRMLDNST